MKLSAEARRWRTKMRKEFDLDDAGAALILQNLLEAFDQLRAAQAIVDVEGLTIIDRFDQVKAHPLCSVIRDCRNQVLGAVKQLGLDIEVTPFSTGPGRPPGR